MTLTLDNQTLLVTGGTGSFGRAFCRYVLANCNPKAIRIFSRDEKKQADMRAEFEDDPHLRFLIGDVRDRDRVYRAVRGADIVIHAAAMKRIEACHYNVEEAVRTNIDGALNVAWAALEQGVGKVLALSSDKAPAAPTLYGKTKAVMEDALIQYNNYTSGTPTRISIVRYGNVFGSRGSVLELWRRQAKIGQLDITHPDMTRFWLTLPQAAEFVCLALERMQGGEILVPRLPSMRIVDLARAIAPKAKHNLIGLRTLERLYEVLITEEEARRTMVLAKHFVIEPEYHFWQRNRPAYARRPEEGWSYRSDTNEEWLTEEEIACMLSPKCRPTTTAN